MPPTDSPPMNSPTTTPIRANEMKGVRDAKVKASAEGTTTAFMICRSLAPRNRARWIRARRQSTTPTPILPPRPDRYAATARSDTGPPVEGSCDG
jgi:hypothetical protein